MFSGVVTEPSKNEKERLEFIERSTKLTHHDKNPCMKEHEMSYKCLDDNSYDRMACSSHFENYRRCKKFWDQIRVERRRAGIVPNLPPPEERDQIKKEYMEKRRASRLE